MSATTAGALSYTLGEADYRAAERAWRRQAMAEMSAGDYAQEIDHWLQERALLLGDLEAGDFSEHDEATIRGGIAYAEHRLAELVRPAERALRAQTPPGYPSRRLTASADLTARFAAAKLVDVVRLVETLTAQEAKPTGNGRHRLRCPFHAGDREPSLVLYPAPKGWYCFGCGKGGDAVAFVSEIQGCTTVEALAFVEAIADMPGVA